MSPEQTELLKAILISTLPPCICGSNDLRVFVPNMHNMTYDITCLTCTRGVEDYHNMEILVKKWRNGQTDSYLTFAKQPN